MKLLPVRLALVLLLVCSVLPAEAGAQEARRDVGDPAPVFEAVDENGAPWQSADVVGKKLLVVYFYPAAMTGGCTKQACGFRDHRTQLTALGAEVVGVSGDPVANLQVFKKTHRLNFPLLSDADGAIARRFGVPVRAGGTVKQTIAGAEVALTRDVTTARWTFIIGLDGRIVYRDTDVEAGRDSEAVIAALQRLRGE